VEPSGKTDPALERLLGTHRSRVPLAAAVGGTGPLAVESVSIDRKGGAPALAVTARAPAGTALELAIETPEDLALPSPPPSVTDAAGKAAFRIELPTAKAPADGTGMLTLSDGDRAVEVPLPLALLSGH
jgi:hypothetical protein